MKVEHWSESAPLEEAPTAGFTPESDGGEQRVMLRPRVNALIDDLGAQRGRLVSIGIVTAIAALLGLGYLAFAGDRGGNSATGQGVGAVTGVVVDDSRAAVGPDRTDFAAVSDGNRSAGPIGAPDAVGGSTDSRTASTGIAGPTTALSVAPPSTTGSTVATTSSTISTTTTPPTTISTTITTVPTTITTVPPPTTRPPETSGAICSVRVRKSVKLRDEPGGDTIGELSSGRYDVHQVVHADETWYRVVTGQASGWIEASKGRVRGDC